QVIDRRPASISFGDYGFVELIGHWRDWCTAGPQALPGSRRRRQSCERLMRLSISFGGSECFRGCGYCLRRRHGSGNEAAAEDARLALCRVIEHAGLPGRHTVFAADQLDFKTRIGAAAQPGGLRRARRAHLDVNFRLTLGGFINAPVTEPVEIAQANAAS